MTLSMKKIILCAVAVLGLFASCDPCEDSEGPGTNITAEELTNGFTIQAESEGNNNITVKSDHYIWLYDAATDKVLGKGFNQSIKLMPPARELKVYALWKGADGSEVKSAEKTITLNNFTKIDPIVATVFGENYDKTTTWTWDDTDDGIVWGNGGWMNDSAPSWWKVNTSDIQGQCTDKGYAKDKIGEGWFTLSLTDGVKTSRGETGSVMVDGTKAKDGWDLGTMTFEGTVPLLGVQCNFGNQREFVYHILKYDGDHLVLCAPEPGVTNSGGTAWYWKFKRIPNK